MKPIALTIALCLLAGMAHGGTFELADPANEMLEELQNPAEPEPLQQVHADESDDEWAGRDIGSISCSEFLSFESEHSEWFWVSMYWLQGFVAGRGSHPIAGDWDAMALWLNSYCPENPRNSLTQTAEALARE